MSDKIEKAITKIVEQDHEEPDFDLTAPIPDEASTAMDSLNAHGYDAFESLQFAIDFIDAKGLIGEFEAFIRPPEED